MRFWIRYIRYLIVFVGIFPAHSGSYDDFFGAIQTDRAEVVQALLNRGFDPNTMGPKGDVGLILALREPSFKVIDVLLAASSTQVDVRTAQDETPLMLASLRGYLDVCKKLIARDADVNKPGWTPLHYAATGGHTNILSLLLDNHAYIDAASPNGSTPLMMAAMYGSLETVKLLLEAGADPALKNGLGLSAVDFANQAQREAVATTISAAIRLQRK